jgi:bifunctional non-homologous end joining protein LigD
MLATLGPLPADDGWSFEPKWDGFRGICVVDRSVRLLSRRGNDLTRLCPGVSVLAKLDLGPAVLDGEIVAFRDGNQSFEALQGVMRHRTGVEDVASLAFDVLWLRGRSLLAVPYCKRRLELESLRFEPPVAISPRFDDGDTLFEQTLARVTKGWSPCDASRSTARVSARGTGSRPSTGSWTSS